MKPSTLCKRQQIICVDWSRDFTEGLITRKPEIYVETKSLKTSDATGFNIEACVCCVLHPSVMCDSLQPQRLYPDPDPAGSSVRGVLQPRILKCVAISSSRESSRPRDRTHISCVTCISGGIFTTYMGLSSPPIFLLGIPYRSIDI